MQKKTSEWKSRKYKCIISRWSRESDPAVNRHLVTKDRSERISFIFLYFTIQDKNKTNNNKDVYL